MKNELRLAQRQNQTLTLTPQLRQAIKLLELPNLELEEILNQALVENPLLTQDPSVEEPLSAREIPSHEEAREGPAPSLDEWKKSEFDPDQEDLWLNRLADKDITLYQHLVNQLNVDIKSQQDQLIGKRLIELIDETGYFLSPLHPIAQQFNCSVEEVEKVLLQLQQFDPAGVFARNLKECLILQLEDQGHLTMSMRLLIENIELLAEKKIDKLLKICHLNYETFLGMTNKIKALDPKPGLKFSSFASLEALTPDVIVFQNRATGEWSVGLNEETLPKLYFNTSYYQSLSGRSSVHKETRKYLQEWSSNAYSLLKALENRKKTILKVAEAILDHQKAFFEEGIKFLKPMILKDVADSIQMHESTVSRVTTSKYMATPRGTFELKYFFSVSYANSLTGEDCSSTSIQHILKELISAEDIVNPYSDDQLVILLKGRGIDVARRTISKYRDILKIPSSYLRKRLKTSHL